MRDSLFMREFNKLLATRFAFSIYERLWVLSLFMRDSLCIRESNKLLETLVFCGPRMALLLVRGPSQRVTPRRLESVVICCLIVASRVMCCSVW